MDSNVIVALIAILLGGGGTAGIGLFVTMLRAHRKGKIEDEGTTIDRLNNEAKDLVRARKHAEAERDREHQAMLDWMTQSFQYRIQLVSATPPIKPDDNPHLWSHHTPVVDPSAGLDQ